MSIINKIKYFKNIKNLLVFRSKYDNVCDELDYKNLEVSKCNDSLFALKKDDIAINDLLADKYVEIDKLKKINLSLDVNINKSIKTNNILINSCNSYKKTIKKLIYLGVAGFVLGLVTGYLITKISL